MRLPFRAPHLVLPVENVFLRFDIRPCDVNACRFLRKATPEQRTGYERALMGATRVMSAIDTAQATSIKKKQSRAKYDWEVVGGFTALNNHQLGALLSAAGQVPRKQPKQDRYGEKTIESRRQQLQKVIRKLMDQEASQQRRLAKRKRQEEAPRLQEQSAWLLQQPANTVSKRIAWACNDKFCGHVGPGCHGWREKQREDMVGGGAAAAAAVGTDGEFGDDSWATNFDPDEAARLGGAVTTAPSTGANSASAARELMYS